MNIYSIKNLISDLAAELITRCTDQHNAEREAWWLLEKVTGQSEAELLMEDMVFLSDEQDEQLQIWVEERVQGKRPLQYILGSVPFYDLDIITKEPILIPRPETEEMVAWLIDIIKKANGSNLGSILDLCTGTGCIALSLAKAFPSAIVVGSDINPQAIALAEKNKRLNNITNAEFIVSDLYQQLDPQKKFDVIISNPPYLSAESYGKVADEIRLWEDPRALIADHQGMAVYEKILKDIDHYLNKPLEKTVYPQLVFEIGIDQISIGTLVKQAGFSRIETYHDMNNKPRWLAAWI